VATGLEERAGGLRTAGSKAAAGDVVHVVPGAGAMARSEYRRSGSRYFGLWALNFS